MFWNEGFSKIVNNFSFHLLVLLMSGFFLSLRSFKISKEPGSSNSTDPWLFITITLFCVYVNIFKEKKQNIIFLTYNMQEVGVAYPFLDVIYVQIFSQTLSNTFKQTPKNSVAQNLSNSRLFMGKDKVEHLMRKSDSAF